VPTSSDDFGVVFINDKLYLIGSSTVFHFDRPYSVSKNTASLTYMPLGYGTIPIMIFPQNVRYNDSNVSLVFTVDTSVTSWVGYSLDEKGNVTIVGNATLTGLSNGEHNITVYTKDNNAAFLASETVTFNIVKPEPFPTVVVAAVSMTLAVALAVAGLLVYHKKHKN
jgi:hypothetical protein